MSAHAEDGQHVGPDEHGHGGTGHDQAPAHGTLRSYLIGFGLSVVLTAIPFWLVMTGVLPSRQATAAVVVVMAFVQIVVHMIYFLHMDSKSQGGWTMMALIFTIMVLVIVLSGSIWVMYHLTSNMMPVTVHSMSELP